MAPGGKDLFGEDDDFAIGPGPSDQEGEPADAAYAEPVVIESAPQNKPAVVTGQSALAIPDFNSIDLGLAGAGVIIAETGVKVSRYPVERLKFTESKKERVSIILDKVIILKTHFSEEIGSIICNGGACCDEFGLPSVRYIFPVVHYEVTDKKGTPITSEIEVYIISIGKDSYEDLLTIMENKGPLSQFDLVVNCTDEGYQKVSFTEAGPALWKQSKKAVAFVADKLKKNGKDLVAAMGRTMTDAQLKKALGADSAPSYDQNVDMGKIFDDSST